MLVSLAIRDLVLVDQLLIEFEPGLSVLTGETGAGKSVLLDSLALALGRRADAGLVRRGAAQAQVAAAFEVAPEHPAWRLAEEHGVEADDRLIFRRTVKADGGSRGYVNDQPASAGLLRALGSLLVEIHGQDDDALLAARGHRALLDRFGHLEAETATVARAHEAWRALRDEQEEALARRDSGRADREWLAHALQELRQLDPRPGEEASLADERAAMLKGQRLAEDLAQAGGLLDGSEGGLAALRQAARRLDRLGSQHERLADAVAALDRALSEAEEAESHLRAAAEDLAYDPRRLEEAEERLFELRALARKHRVEPEALPGLRDELEARLGAAESGEERVQALAAAVAQARSWFEEASAALSGARLRAGEALDRAVARELPPLRLDAARFRTVVEPLGETQWSAAGRDRVEFEVATNPGAPFGPLLRIASGGELARLTLALKVALGEVRPVPTMVFDEIDKGVGGAVASAVGERLQALARRTQVLVVTHSPQVAARGTHQWLIAKSVQAGATRTSVRPLDPGGRREEIARMLSGAEVTDEARAQASRLLAQVAS